MLRKLLLCVIAMTFLSLSCASIRQNIVSESEILEKLEFNRERLTSFRGMADVDFYLGGQKGTVELLIVAERSGNLRLETGNFFGAPLSALTIHRQKLTYYVIPEEKIYIGDPSDLADRVLPLGITEKDLQGLIFFSASTYKTFRKSKKFQLDLFDFQIDERLHFYYPAGFKLTQRDTQDFIRIRWQGYDLNPDPFPRELFHIKKPAQARTIQWRNQSITPVLTGEEQPK